MNSMDRKLVTKLTGLGLLNQRQAEDVGTAADRTGRPVDLVVVEMGFVSEELVAKHVARLNSLEFLDMKGFEPDPEVIKLLRPSQARRYRAIPIGLVGEMLVVAVCDASNVLIVDDLRAVTGKTVQAVFCTHSGLESALDRFYVQDGPPTAMAEELPMAPPSPVGGVRGEAEGGMQAEPDSEARRLAARPAMQKIPASSNFPFAPRGGGNGAESPREINSADTVIGESTTDHEAPSESFRHPESTSARPDSDTGIEIPTHTPEPEGGHSHETRFDGDERPVVAVNDRATILEIPVSEVFQNAVTEFTEPIHIEPSISTMPTKLVPLGDMDTVMEEERLRTSRAELTPLPVAPHDSQIVEKYATPSPISTDEVFLRAIESHRRAGQESDAPEGEVDILLKHMLDDALAERAEELELSPPSARKTCTRIRKNGVWQEMLPYPLKLHDSLVDRIRLIAGVANDRENPVERSFVLEGKRGNIPVVASFLPTAQGDRCLLRFPENIPLVQRPLRVLGVRQETIDEIDRRLGGAGGGLLLISAQYSRLSSQLYASLLHDQAMKNRAVVSIDWAGERTIPNITQHICRDEAGVRRALESLAQQAPDLAGVAAIPNAAVMQSVMGLAVRGRSIVATMTSADSARALAIYPSAEIDNLVLTNAVICHVHVSAVPRLCGKCREAMTELPARLPAWASTVRDKRLYEARGCEACKNTGRKGTSWVSEVFVPDINGSGTLNPVRTREEALAQLAAEAWLDVRDVRE